MWVQVMLQNNQIQLLANSIKILSADAVEQAKSGHPGTAVGAAEIMATLFVKHLNFNPQNPTWLNRDRFVLSAGHACIMQYATLHLLGYKHFNINAIKNLRQLNSITSGHPEIEHEAGIEVTTGPLGEGVSMAVGLAIAERNTNTKFNQITHHTYAFVGDGCLMEGVSYEALSLAGTLCLNKLIVIYDNNNITIDGELSVANTENIALRMQAMGFNVTTINGHDITEIDNALNNAKNSTKPSFIIAKTIIAKNAGNKQGTEASHGSPFGAENIALLRKNLNWQNQTAFEIPQDIKDLWQQVANHKIQIATTWQNAFNNSANQTLVNNHINHLTTNNLTADLQNLANTTIQDNKAVATRVASSKVLNVIKNNVNFVIGGSADLSGSNNTITPASKAISINNFSGNYIHYGVREHAMGAIMLGLASYGAGIVPYGGTFLVFSDFLRPTIRLAALMQRQVIFVFTHDNISVGGDGPTHQPIEHLASLRLIPNLEVLRPADTIETIEAYNIALANKNKPTAIILGRNPVATVRTEFNPQNNLVQKGGYVIFNNTNIAVNLISSGSEVSLMFAVKDMLLQQHNIQAQIISMPSLNLFAQQSAEYKKQVLKNNPNIVVEAGNLTGYKDVLGSNTLLYGINTFGKSGNPEDVMEHFGFTAQAITKYIISNLETN